MNALRPMYVGTLERTAIVDANGFVIYRGAGAGFTEADAALFAAAPALVNACRAALKELARCGRWSCLAACDLRNAIRQATDGAA